jgi:hypothetical protein
MKIEPYFFLMANVKRPSRSTNKRWVLSSPYKCA